MGLRASRGQIVSGQCGIGAIKGFITEENAKDVIAVNHPRFTREKAAFELELAYPQITSPKAHVGGAGFVGTGFINTTLCQQAYEELCEEYQLVFQTPVRKNTNSGNNFFYAMWNTSGEKDIEPITPKWPY